ncbi:hypothetical protein CHS0354_017849 [Potamilus streckersoni]|uniref:tRNA N(3)-methylcytidine methyltransferase n=1 Tax=Potamilus streckersoni TaxID=2493646 RepID=A0AAE0W8X0_9BIVA|nr:hypothetical protein CHS0354_017849 [Potamilus streckersoni]
MMEQTQDIGDNEKRPQFGNRILTDSKNVFEHNAWDNVVWDEKQEEDARRITSQQLSTPVPEHDKEKFEENAFEYWNEFYMQHQNRFFKDRHWLFTEFPELLAGDATLKGPMSETSQTVNQENHSHQEVKIVKQHEQEMKKVDSEGCNMVVEGNSEIYSQDAQSIIREGPTCTGASYVGSTEEINRKCSNVKRVDTDLRDVKADSNMNQDVTESDEKKDGYPGEYIKYKILEVGCGVGNTVFPILQATNNPNLMVYCCDFSMTAIDLVKEHPDYNPSRCHAFVWDITDSDASIPLPKDSLDVIILIFVLSAIHPSKMQGVVDCLASYLKPGGMIVFRDYGRYDMAQLRFKPGRCLSENFYVRGDGTRVYFFTQDELREMFTKAGLVEDQNLIDRRLQVNRGRQLKMYRVWIQCKYRKPIHQSSETAASS